MKKTSVLFVTGIFYPDVGGPAIHVRRFADYLYERGHRVRVITYTAKKEGDQFPYPVTRITLGPKFLRWVFFTITTFFYTPRYSVVYGHDLSTAGFPAVFSAKFFGKKVLVRNVGDQLWERAAENGKTKLSFTAYYKNNNHSRDYPIVFRTVRFVLKNVHTYITASPLLKEIHAHYYGVKEDKIILLPNPRNAPSSRNEDSIKKEPFPTFIFGGRFVSYKNLILTVRAFALCFKKYKQGELLLIGGGPEKEKLEEEIRRLDISPYVRILPSMPHTMITEHIRRAHIGLAPALTEFNPNFALECLSAGLPILISRENGLIPALPEEFIADVSSPEVFSEKMSQFFNKDMYNELQQKIAKLPRGITWDEYLEKQYAIITNL
jgi:glycosyltransferase involved in cell wall biosynthesis